MTKTEAACCVGLVRMHGGHELADKLMAVIMPLKAPSASARPDRCTCPRASDCARQLNPDNNDQGSHHEGAHSDQDDVSPVLA